MSPIDLVAMREHGLDLRAPGWSIRTDGFIVAPSGVCVRARPVRDEAIREVVTLARSFLRSNPESLARGHAHWRRWRDCVSSFADWHLAGPRTDDTAALYYLSIEWDAVKHGIDWGDVIAAVGAGDA